MMAKTTYKVTNIFKMLYLVKIMDPLGAEMEQTQLQ